MAPRGKIQTIHFFFFFMPSSFNAIYSERTKRRVLIFGSLFVYGVNIRMNVKYFLHELEIRSLIKKASIFILL